MPATSSQNQKYLAIEHVTQHSEHLRDLCALSSGIVSDRDMHI